MKRQEQDPQRWVERGRGPSIEDEVGATIRAMGEPLVPDDAALMRLQARVVTPRRRSQGSGRMWRPALAAGVVLLLAGGVVSAQRGTFPFLRERVSAIGELSVPRGSTVRMRGKRHRQIALVGPAEVTVGNDDGNTDSLTLREGLVAIEAGDQPLAVSMNGLSVTVPAGSAGAVSALATGEREAIALEGTVEVTSASGKAAVGEGQIWRQGGTRAATPELLDSVGRALRERPLPAPAAVPATTTVEPARVPAPTPAAMPAPTTSPANVSPAPAARAKRAAPRPVTLAIAEPASRRAIADRPLPLAAPDRPLPPPPETMPAPPPFPAPPLPMPRALPVPQLPPPATAVAGSPPDRELALIATAVRKLRADDDPRGALAILDEHGARFPQGSLAREATLARVETLLALDRRAEALRVLDGATIADLPRARAVRATRGELRAELGRCADALKDFALLLSSEQRDEYGERALYGRAACRARGGDAARAWTDLTLYQTLYPQGRFAAEVQRLRAGH